MNNKINCFFSDVSEHDMDLLFLEEFVCSKEFLTIFTSQIGIKCERVISVYSSKTDVSLGESDITVIIESNGEKIGLLIEDKIDAVAMPEQALRYNKRGQKGIEHGDYTRFFVFIIAPRKYLSQNNEAQNYQYKVEYETILSYFESINDARAPFKIKQIKQAIDKQKKGYQVEIDPLVTEFWNKYSEYQKTYYPELYFLYNGEAKGANATWTRFRTVIDGVYMYHKTEFGYVDLTLDKCADKIIEIERLLSDSVGDFIKEGYTVHKTNKSAAIRLIVPILDLHKPFNQQKNNVEKGFAAVKKISEMVKLFDVKTIYSLIQK